MAIVMNTDVRWTRGFKIISVLLVLLMVLHMPNFSSYAYAASEQQYLTGTNAKIMGVGNSLSFKAPSAFITAEEPAEVAQDSSEQLPVIDPVPDKPAVQSAESAAPQAVSPLIYNCAVAALSQLLPEMDTGTIAARLAPFISFGQTVMAGIQKVASELGLFLSGRKISFTDLESSRDKTLVHLDLGNGLGHYVTVTKATGTEVTYEDGGQTKTMSKTEFESLWSKNVLTTNAAAGSALSLAEMFRIKGAGFLESASEAFSAFGSALESGFSTVASIGADAYSAYTGGITAVAGAVTSAVGAGISEAGTFISSAGSLMSSWNVPGASAASDIGAAVSSLGLSWSAVGSDWRDSGIAQAYSAVGSLSSTFGNAAVVTGNAMSAAGIPAGNVISAIGQSAITFSAQFIKPPTDPFAPKVELIAQALDIGQKVGASQKPVEADTRGLGQTEIVFRRQGALGGPVATLKINSDGTHLLYIDNQQQIGGSPDAMRNFNAIRETVDKLHDNGFTADSVWEDMVKNAPPGQLTWTGTKNGFFLYTRSSTPGGYFALNMQTGEWRNYGDEDGLFYTVPIAAANSGQEYNVGSEPNGMNLGTLVPR